MYFKNERNKQWILDEDLQVDGGQMGDTTANRVKHSWFVQMYSPCEHFQFLFYLLLERYITISKYTYPLRLRDTNINGIRVPFFPIEQIEMLIAWIQQGKEIPWRFWSKLT